MLIRTTCTKGSTFFVDSFFFITVVKKKSITLHGMCKVFLYAVAVIACSLLVCHNCNSQTCGTVEEDLQHAIEWKLAGPEFVSGERNVLSIPVKLHTFGSDFGNFMLDSTVAKLALEDANLLHEAGNIQFVQCGAVNQIKSTPHVEFRKTTDEYICVHHDDPEAINIYFALDILRQDGSSICGYAYNYPEKQRLFMDNSCALNGSTLAHELGHSLSLLHTHSTKFGKELADGSNCATAGDLFCDTPADPNLSDLVSVTCQYTGTETDPNGQAYLPDTRNIMSYSKKSCRTYFSSEQIDQMRAYHLTHQDLLYCGDDSLSSAVDRSIHSIEVSVYPNPVVADWTVFNLPIGGNLSVFSAKGELLWTTEIAHQTMQFQSTDLAPGLNVVHITNHEKTQTIPILKLLH